MTPRSRATPSVARKPPPGPSVPTGATVPIAGARPPLSPMPLGVTAPVIECGQCQNVPHFTRRGCILTHQRPFSIFATYCVGFFFLWLVNVQTMMIWHYLTRVRIRLKILVSAVSLRWGYQGAMVILLVEYTFLLGTYC